MELEEEEKFPLIDIIPPPVMVEILRFVFADEKELRRGAAPQVSSAWRFRTMEYLSTIGQKLEPSHRFLMLRHIAVFRSISWKILSSLRPKILSDILNEIGSDMSTEITAGLGRVPEVSIFILKTKRESVVFPTLTPGKFVLLSASLRHPTLSNTFRVQFFPEAELPFKKVHLNFLPEKNSNANIFITGPNDEILHIQEYEIALHIAKTPTMYFGIGVPTSLIGKFFVNVERITTGGKPFVGFDRLLSRMLIVSTRVRVSSRVLGTRKIGKEDVKENSIIEGGGEYVYSSNIDEDEGVLVALGSALFEYADSVIEETPWETIRGKSALFKFSSEDSTLEQASIFFETTTAFMFNSIEEIRSAVPYDRIFFSNEIPSEELERLFMIQSKELEKKALGKAKMKGGEVYEF